VTRRHGLPERSHGFTLLETLIAMLVLSIGLLGAIRLGLETVRIHREAIYQSRAVGLAGSMAERVRSNHYGRSSYAGSGSDQSCRTETAPGRLCSPAEMAAHDLFEWHKAIADSLPEGAGLIASSTDEALSRYLITIEWRVGETTRRRRLEVLL
jgi:type IV pilus assembly protein PilV